MRPSAAVARGARLLGSAAEARTLLAHVMAVDPTQLLLLAEVPQTQLDAFDALVARRLTGEPLQHLTGRAFFRGIEVEVGPGVFIPRPESELLAGWAIERLGEVSVAGGAPVGRPRRPIVVELCAGSGAISRSLSMEFGDAQFWAVELSPGAWPYLCRNLAGTNVRPVLADMAVALPDLDGGVDVIVVNPPYVPETARQQLPADVLRDPDQALFSGADGLDAIRVVTRVASRLLRPGGWVGCEHDDSHRESAPELFRQAGFDAVSDLDDLAGRPRFVVARKPGPHLAG